MPPITLLNELSFKNTGEKKAFMFLGALPENYYVLRELRTDPSLDKKQHGSNEDRPDLVVIGPEIGVVVLEVKDWNISNNIYEWKDQYKVTKTDKDGKISEVDSPYPQVDEYQKALAELLRKLLGTRVPWVTGFVVFPKIEKADFENNFSFENSGGSWGSNPQQRFLYDPNRTIFSEELAEFWHNPLALLMQRLKKLNNPLYNYHQNTIEQTVNYLIPEKLRVGFKTAEEKAKEAGKLRMLDDTQQQWAFSTANNGENYLLDVAGSGKTNILVSRAMHLVDTEGDHAGFKILLLTYNEALAKDMRNILSTKLGNSNIGGVNASSNRYAAIKIFWMEKLMEKIVRSYFEKNEQGFEQWRKQIIQEAGEKDYLEYNLPEKCMDILDKEPEKIEKYDHLLIDEVQDFSTEFLYIARELIKNPRNVFMVGDAGQKLFDRELNLSELDIVEERVKLPRQYQMYRNPAPVAKLAWNFLTSDKDIANDLKEQGYETKIKFKSPVSQKPVFRNANNRGELFQMVVNNIQNHLDEVRAEQLLCIGLEDSLQKLEQLLESKNIYCCRAKENEGENAIVLADFVEAKGLERNYVFILDIDRLPNIIANYEENSQEDLEKKARLSRIKIFVALTRTIQNVTAYYTNVNNVFIRELLELNKS